MRWMKPSTIRVATHGCPHHIDELVAVALLERWARSRGQVLEVTFLPRAETAARADEFHVLVDIGLEHDPERGRFDHHQGGSDVANRSAAGLVFEALGFEPDVAAYLRPVIALIDRIDNGLPGPRRSASPDEGRAAGMLSLSTLLKAVGGFEFDEARGRRCLELVAALVDRWFEEAEQYRDAVAILARARPVGAGIFLAPTDQYGPGLEQRLRDGGPAFVGFQQAPDRFQVVALRDAEGVNKIVFAPDLPGARFVHARGFLAVFPDAATAEAALRPPLSDGAQPVPALQPDRGR